ncbi:MAG: carbohydrate-binding family 9-like protein [Treponema sp.]|jgi:hypothetical protein|nr:carbohydrate-binding family 9-like protein [Treponema sp.]
MRKMAMAAVLLAAGGLVFAGGAKQKPAPVYTAAKAAAADIVLDGTPDEAVWNSAAALKDFSYPWETTAAPATVFKAFHDDANFYFAFTVTDSQVLAVERFGDERATVDIEDRVEIFFAPAPIDKPDTYFKDDAGYALPVYYAIEVDALGRVHDYSMVFYRAQMDSNWALPGLETAGKLTDTGYTVEGKIPLASLRTLGLIQAGGAIRAGVFRAEFSGSVADSANIIQRWISWADPVTTAPDFHVETAFGIIRLTP